MMMQQNSECYMVYIQILNRLALQQQCLFGYIILEANTETCRWKAVPRSILQLLNNAVKMNLQTCSYDSSSHFKLVQMIQALVKVDTKIALQFYYLIKFIITSHLM